MQTRSMRQRINSHFHPKAVYQIKPLEQVNWLLPDLMECLASGSLDLVEDYLTVEAHVSHNDLKDYIKDCMRDEESKVE